MIALELLAQINLLVNFFGVGEMLQNSSVTWRILEFRHFTQMSAQRKCT